jgi:DNA polymerase-3 subunit gamma/tau
MYYTKYRPQTFSEIFEPNLPAKALMEQLKTGSFVHAYLFVGPRGSGKTTTARLLAKAVNCLKLTNTGDPCNSCENCKNFVDVIEIDAASNRGIDDIRILKEKVNISPNYGKYKVYIIDEVHMLTKEAFNALLKTLEEPPSHVIFILCTTEAHKILDTIKSRCQQFAFKRATVSQLTKKLKYIAKQENIKITQKDLAKISEAAFGGFRDAETLLEQYASGHLNLNLTHDENTYLSFVSALHSKNVSEALGIIKHLEDSGVDLVDWNISLLKYLRGLLFLRYNLPNYISDLDASLEENSKDMLKKVGDSELLLYLSAFNDSIKYLKESVIPSLGLELAIFKVCTGSEVKTASLKTIVDTKTVKIEELKDSLIVEDSQAPKEISKIISEPKIETIEVTSREISYDLNKLQENWDTILKSFIGKKGSLRALLKMATPVKLHGDKLYLEVTFDFHKERIELEKNRLVIEETITSIMGASPRIYCEVNADKKPKSKENVQLTDLNISVPAQDDVAVDSLIEVFDGGLPTYENS